MDKVLSFKQKLVSVASTQWTPFSIWYNSSLLSQETRSFYSLTKAILGLLWEQAGSSLSLSLSVEPAKNQCHTGSLVFLKPTKESHPKERQASEELSSCLKLTLEYKIDQTLLSTSGAFVLYNLVMKCMERTLKASHIRKPRSATWNTGLGAISPA